jgi:hypothetical protein
MDLNRFWSILDSTLGHENRAEALRLLLMALPDGDIVQFRICYDDVLLAANTVDLWGAAYQINAGCSEDDFYYFREGIIERGRAFFETTVNCPDGLAAFVTPPERIEGMDALSQVPMLAWVEKTSNGENEFYAAVDAEDSAGDRGNIEHGEHWEFSDPEEVRHRLPQLAKRYLPLGE